MTHTLFFVGRDSTRQIAVIDAADRSPSEVLDEALHHIHEFLKSCQYTSHYTRYWTEGSVMTFDFGSHTEFFRLDPAP